MIGKKKNGENRTISIERRWLVLLLFAALALAGAVMFIVR